MKTNALGRLAVLVVSLPMANLTLGADPRLDPKFKRYTGPPGSIVGWGYNNYGQTNCPAGTNYIAVATGTAHSLALRTDGSIVGWGYNNYGQTNCPAGTNYVAIAAGEGHSVALRTDGSIVVWGNGNQTNCPAGTNYVAIAAGAMHSVALRTDGSIVAWGNNSYGETNCPAGTDYVAIGAGVYYSAALCSSGAIVAWGDNVYGQTDCPAGTDYVAIAAGGYHGLSLLSNGSVVPWGRNDYGQTNCPVLTDSIAIAAGSYHSLALRVNGTIVGWGRNDSGQTNCPAGTNGVIAAGWGHSLALAINYSPSAFPFIDVTNVPFTVANDVTSCSLLGTNNANVVGGMWVSNATIGGASITFPASASWAASTVSLAVGANVISVYGSNLMGVVTSTNVSIWRYSIDGSGEQSGSQFGRRRLSVALGFGSLSGVTGPFIAVAAGSSFVIGLSSDGTLVSWGGMNCPSGSNYVAIACGDSHSIALQDDGTLVAWGNNNRGQTNCPLGSNFVAVAGGEEYSMALRSDGTLLGWGLAPGYPQGSNYIALAAGNNHVIALRGDGTIVGDGCPSGSNYVAIAAGGSFSTALRNDGSLVAWGINNWGQTNCPLGSNFVAIANGRAHVVALKNDGAIMAWGCNDSGQTNCPGGSMFNAIAAGTSCSVALYPFLSPFVDITNTPTTVAKGVTTCSIGGTNNQVVGDMTWINHLTLASGSFTSCEFGFTISGIALGIGTNVITVSSTNRNVLGAVASDSVTIVRLGAAFVDITTPAHGRTTVCYDVTSCVISGTNNVFTVGVVQWSNNLTIAGGSFAATTDWSIADISLVVGTNVISVYCSNEFGMYASDSATITRGGIGTGMPFVDITNLHGVVCATVSNYTICGTNNAHVVGGMWATNKTAGGSAQNFPASAGWSSPYVSLVAGMNNIVVFGTNVWGEIASNSAIITWVLSNEIVISSPIDGSLIYTSSVAFLLCGGSEIEMTYLSTNDGLSFFPYTSGTPLTMPGDGVYRWTAYGDWDFGTETAFAPHTNTLIVYTAPPRVRLVSPTNATLVSDRFAVDLVADYGLSRFERQLSTNNGLAWFDYVPGEPVCFGSTGVYHWTARSHDYTGWGYASATNTLIIGATMVNDRSFALLRPGNGTVVTNAQQTFAAAAVGSFGTFGFMFDGTGNVNGYSYPFVTNVGRGVHAWSGNGRYSLPPWYTLFAPSTNTFEVLLPGQDEAVRLLAPINRLARDVGYVHFDALAVGVDGLEISLNGGVGWQELASPMMIAQTGTYHWTVRGTNSGGTHVYANRTNTLYLGIEPGANPFVDIINAPAVVPFSVTNYVVAGTNNASVVGDMWVTNAAAGGPQQTFPAPAVPGWTAPAVPLAVGSNMLVVCGTNEMGTLASDSLLVFRLGPPPDAPTGVVATDGTYTNKIRVTWTAASNATAYAVYRNSSDDTNGAVVMANSIVPTVYDDSSVVPGQLYYYWVRAWNTNGWSSLSAGDSGYAQATVGPVPVVLPLFLDFSTNHTVKNITVINTGSGSFTFTSIVASGSQWLAVSPQEGAVSSQAVSLVASVNRASMDDRTYVGVIAITPAVGADVMVTCQMVVAGNSVVARPGGPYVADQGSPVTFDASGSTGAGLQYRWEAGGFISSFSNAHVRFAYIGYVPGTNEVLLTIKDNRVPTVYSSANTFLTIRNVAPSIDSGGPYTGTVNRVVSFNAVVNDPGTGDVLNVRWDFGDGGGWQSWYGLAATNMTHTYLVAGSYVVQCQARDNYSAESAVDMAGVFIDMPNQPPTARATLGSPGVVLSNFASMHMEFILDGSGATDDRLAITNLHFDWREDVHNPAKPLLTDVQRRMIVVTNPVTFPLPGVYRYHLVVNDGEYNSAPATVQINVPGVRGIVRAEGMMALLPVWGVTLVATNHATGAVDWRLSDTDGKFVLDTGMSNSCVVVLSRGDQQTVRIMNVGVDGVSYPEPEALLTFPARSCGLSAIVNTGFYGGAWQGLPGALGRIVVGDTVAYNGDSDLQGQMAFGGIPELYPRTATVNYPVLYQKGGYESKVMLLPADPAVVAQQQPTMNAAPPQGCIVQGTVLGTNNMAVEGVKVDFGPAFSPAFTANDGTFAASNIMLGEYFVQLSADQFDTTYDTVTIPPLGTNVYTLPQPLRIRGGRFWVYGEVLDGGNGRPLGNALVSSVEEGGKRMMKSSGGTNDAATTMTGYYDLPLVKGTRAIRVEAGGYYATNLVLDMNGHVPRTVQLTPVPEPVVAGAVIATGVCLLAWRSRNVGT